MRMPDVDDKSIFHLIRQNFFFDYIRLRYREWHEYSLFIRQNVCNYLSIKLIKWIDCLSD